MLIEWLIALLLVSGGFFVFAAGLGLYRLPDLMIRMHASTKAGTLGVGLILVAVAVDFGDLGTVAKSVATILFLLLTAPIAAHMIGRASYRIGVPLWERSIVDQWKEREGDPTVPIKRTPEPLDGA